MLFKHKKSLVKVSSSESGKEVAMEWGAEASRNKVDAHPDNQSLLSAGETCSSLVVILRLLLSIRAGEVSSAF